MYAINMFDHINETFNVEVAYKKTELRTAIINMSGITKRSF